MFGFLKKRSPPSPRPDGLQGPWPLKFDSFAFGARCYNTLACSILFNNYQHSLRVHEPSGTPYAADWKDHWHAGYNMDRDIVTQGFPPPVQVKWTALDEAERRAESTLRRYFRTARSGTMFRGKMFGSSGRTINTAEWWIS